MRMRLKFPNGAECEFTLPYSYPTITEQAACDAILSGNVEVFTIEDTEIVTPMEFIG